MKILIVDDDFTSRALLLRIMEPIGDCEVACNGKEAWDAFQAAYADGLPYDLVLLDIMMPEMNGHEVLKRIRTFEKGQNLTGKQAVSVAMATTLGDSANIINSFHNQSDGYLTKPYNRESLLGDLRKFGILPRV
jgi:two-component system, chemotaxis family, chemotaxis protein CheY